MDEILKKVRNPGYNRNNRFWMTSMADPITLTAGAIATLAFTKFLESAAGEAGKKLTEATLKKMDTLRLAISRRFQGNPKAESAIVAIEQNGSPAELERLTKYLDVAMMDDEAFASEITAIAHEIAIDQSETTFNQQNINYGRDQIMINQPGKIDKIGGS